jgi:hypothetical protein
MTTTTQLQPIVNGSFNHDLTEEQMLEFDFDCKKRMVWNLIVSMGSAHNFRNVDPKVYKKLSFDYMYEGISEDNADHVLIDVRKLFNDNHAAMLKLTEDLYFEQGQQIFKVQRELGFSGFLRMDFRKLMGYVTSMGNWNDFNGKRVAQAIKHLDSMVPKFSMPNNCNNGNSLHQWFMQSDYITMKLDYLSETDKDKYLRFYKEHWEPTARNIQADSVRYELEFDNESKRYTLEMIYWWD